MDSSSETPEPALKLRPRRAWWLLLSLFGLMIVGLIVELTTAVGRKRLAVLAVERAQDELARWALSSAQPWLNWAEWFDGQQFEVDLARAVYHRRWGETEKWAAALRAAEQKSAPERRLQSEVALDVVRSGQDVPWIAEAEGEFLEVGTAPDDVATAFLDRFLARGDFAAAQAFLERWQEQHDSPHVSYLWGFYWLRLQVYEKAQPHFEETLRQQPEHELARKMTAELLEMQDRLAAALEQHRESVRRSPHSQVAKLGMARTLRKLNRPVSAREILQPLADREDPLPIVVHEMAQLELESGNYEQAREWWLGDQSYAELSPDQLLPAAIATHLLGDPPAAQQMIDRYEAVAFDSVRSYDLQLRLALDSTDQQALHELRTRQEPGTVNPASSGNASFQPSAPYERHCSACHGADGGGNGSGSRHLFPPARNFRAGRFRFVSTRNQVPTANDIGRIIRVGIPGTSMPAYPELSPHEVERLAEEVLGFFERGLRERVRANLAAGGEPVSDQAVESIAARSSTPGPVVTPPEFTEPTSSGLRRGAELFQTQGCRQCHGEDGQGVAGLSLVDSHGRWTRPRDFRRQPFKSGDDPEQLFLRIRLGMPGTPHPAAADPSDEEISDLVHFCRSLAGKKTAPMTNYERRLWARAGK